MDDVYDEDDEEMKPLFTKEDLDVEVTTIERIPEPDRSVVLKLDMRLAPWEEERK